MDDVIQGTAEWFALRLGKVTASRVADVVAKTKSGWGASRANYQAELIAERLTGVPAEGFKSAAMQWGTDMEPEARRAYEFMRDVEVVQTGFVNHPSILDAGCSPDGYVGEHGLVEIKAPNTATQIETLITLKVPGRYVTQCQFQMACTGAKWCDYASYDPRLPEEMQLFVQRVERDDVMIASLEKEVKIFLAELKEKINQLQKQYAPVNTLLAG